MAVIHPRIRPQARKRRPPRPALNILRSMSNLRIQRRDREISRKDFLRKWGIFRNELRRTPEYLKFREAVIERAGGVCERCGLDANTVHHKRQVSWTPQHALDPKHGELVCKECHAVEHPWLKSA